MKRTSLLCTSFIVICTSWGWLCLSKLQSERNISLLHLASFVSDVAHGVCNQEQTLKDYGIPSVSGGHVRSVLWGYWKAKSEEDFNLNGSLLIIMFSIAWLQFARGMWSLQGWPCIEVPPRLLFFPRLFIETFSIRLLSCFCDLFQASHASSFFVESRDHGVHLSAVSRT